MVESNSSIRSGDRNEVMREDDWMQTWAWLRRSQAGKMLTPLLSILAALAMGVAAFAIYVVIQKGEQLQVVQRNLQLAESENSDLKSRIETVQQAKARLEEDLTGAQRSFAESQEELANSLQAQKTLTKRKANPPKFRVRSGSSSPSAMRRSGRWPSSSGRRTTSKPS